MARTTIENGKVNVDSMVRKILGLECSKAVPFNMLTADEKKAYWNVASCFRRTSQFRGSRGYTAYKTGAGMKLIEKFVNEHC